MSRTNQNPEQPSSWEKLSLSQLIEWAAGYILIAVGRGEYRQAVDSMIRQAYSNGWRERDAQLAAPPRRARRNSPRRRRRAA